MTRILGVISGLVILALLAYFVLFRSTSTQDSSVAEIKAAVSNRDPFEVQRLIGELREAGNQTDCIALLEGARALYLGHSDLALVKFNQLDPEGALRNPLLTLTGEALYLEGDLQNAEICLRLALTDDAENVDAHRWLAIVYYDLGAVDMTLGELDEVSKRVTQDFRPHYMRGTIHSDFGHHEEAIHEFQLAIDLAGKEPASMPIREALAKSQMALKRFDAALQTLADCSKSGTALALKADCLWQLGRADEAQAALKAAEEFGPPSNMARRLQARMKFESGDLEGALKLLEAVVAVDSADEEAEYQLALIFRQMNDEEMSQRHMQRVDDIKSFKTELTELSQTAMEEPQNAEVREALAEICEQLGQRQLAKVWRTAAESCRQNIATKDATP